MNDCNKNQGREHWIPLGTGSADHNLVLNEAVNQTVAKVMVMPD